MFLQQAAFFDACTDDTGCDVVAVQCGTVEAEEWMLCNAARTATLATLRGGVSARKFATLDAAYRLCCKAVPEDSGVDIGFGVVR